MCSGSGAGDLGLKLAMPGARTVCYVEREAHCAGSLVEKMRGRALAEAPVWTDAATFDGSAWRGRVHCVVATYPCQPFSCAGKKLGAKDPRHIWPEIYRVIQEADPDFVFLENVRGHLRNGFREVRRDLERAGYRVEPGLFSAEEVGAPHARVRLFALAFKPGRRLGMLRQPSGIGGQPEGSHRELADAGYRQLPEPGRRSCDRTGAGPADAQLEDTAWADGTRGGRDFRRRRGAGQGSGEFGHAQNRNKPRQRAAPADARIAPGRPGVELDRSLPFPPYRTGDFDRWEAVLVQCPWLRPALAQAETEYILRRMADGLADQLVVGPERTDRLRAVGNGVVPLTVAVAFRVLARRAGLA